MAHDTLSDASRQFLDHLWRTFERYCELVGEPALPAKPTTVVDFLLAEHERLAPATLRRTIRAIEVHHNAAGAADPTADDGVQGVLRGIEGDLLRQVGHTPRVTVFDPVPHPDVVRMVGALGESPLDLRDRALLLTGAAARLSKSALVTLQVGGIRGTKEHLELVVLDRGAERVYRLPRTPGLPDLPAIVEAWTSAAGIATGPVFRSVDRWGNVRAKAMSPQAVGGVLKRLAREAGLPPARGSAEIFSERPEQ